MVSRLDDIKNLPVAERMDYYSNFDFNLLNNSYIKFVEYKKDASGQELTLYSYCYIDKVISSRYCPYLLIVFNGYGYIQYDGWVQYFDGNHAQWLLVDPHNFTDIEFISEEEFSEALNQTSLVKFVKKKIEEGIL